MPREKRYIEQLEDIICDEEVCTPYQVNSDVFRELIHYPDKTEEEFGENAICFLITENNGMEYKCSEKLINTSYFKGEISKKVRGF